jgi:hypothetical protein
LARWLRPSAAPSSAASDQPGRLAQGPEEKRGLRGRTDGGVAASAMADAPLQKRSVPVGGRDPRRRILQCRLGRKHHVRDVASSAAVQPLAAALGDAAGCSAHQRLRSRRRFARARSSPRPRMIVSTWSRGWQLRPRARPWPRSVSRTRAVARVAWAQIATSVVGGNRQSCQPAPSRPRRAVSERLRAAAIALRVARSYHSESGTTASGSPAKVWSAMATTSHRGISDLER